MTAFRARLTSGGRRGSVQTMSPRGLAAAAAALILLLTVCAMQAAAAEPGPVLAEAEGQQNDAIEPPTVPTEELRPFHAAAEPQKASKPAKRWALAASSFLALLLAGVLAHYAFTRPKESWRDDAAAAYEKLVNVLAGALGKPKDEEGEAEVQVVKPKPRKRPLRVNLREKEAVLDALASKFDERELPLFLEKADAASIQKAVKDMLLAKEAKLEFMAGGLFIEAVASIDMVGLRTDDPAYHAPWKTLISALEKSTEQIEKNLEAVLETGTPHKLALGGPWSPNPPSLILEFSPAPMAKDHMRRFSSAVDIATKVIADSVAAWLMETKEKVASFFFNDLEVTAAYAEEDAADPNSRGEMADLITEDPEIVRHLCETVLYDHSDGEAAYILGAPHTESGKHSAVPALPSVTLKLKARRISAGSEEVSEEAKNAILAVSHWLPLTQSRSSAFSVNTFFGAVRRSYWFNRERNRTDEELKTMADWLSEELEAQSHLIDEALSEASKSHPSYVLIYLPEIPEVGAVLAFELL